MPVVSGVPEFNLADSTTIQRELMSCHSLDGAHPGDEMNF